MLFKYRDIGTLSVKSDLDEKILIKDLYIDQANKAHFVLIETGSLLSKELRLVPIAAFWAPKVADGTIRSSVNTELLDHAKVVSTAPDSLVDGVKAMLQTDTPQEVASPVGPLRSIAHHLGVTLDMNEGPFGRILDAVFDADSFEMLYFVVETGSILPERQVILPATQIVDFDWTSRSAHVTVTLEDVQKAPDVHEVDEIESKPLGTVMTYYGIGS